MSTEKSEKGLAEIYEDEFMKQMHNVDKKKDELDAKKRELDVLFRRICVALDRLCNADFTPAAAVKTLSVTSSAPALAMEEALRCVAALHHGDDCLLETLEHYLLDARLNVTRTADMMFLHKNTIKYRLQRVAERLGFVPGDLPESIPLFTACALGRLLRGR